MELAYKVPEERARAYILDMIEKTGAEKMLSPAYLRRLLQNGQRLRNAIPAYYALALDNSYLGMSVPTSKEYWNLFFDNKNKPPKAVTCSWPLRAIAHEWKRSTPAYQYAIEPNNARSIWLFVVAGCGAAEDRFDTYWSAYAGARPNNPNLTWPEYLWQRFGK